MYQLFVTILIGLIGGAAVGVQGPIAGSMGQRVGGVASSFIVHLSGVLFSGALLFLRGGEKIRDWQSLPTYMLFSGIFGLILYLTITYTLPRLGGAAMVALVIVGQLLIGALVDQFGWFGVVVRPITLARLAGLALLLAGGYLVAK